jgi:hypothetical protein
MIKADKVLHPYSLFVLKKMLQINHSCIENVPRVPSGEGKRKMSISTEKKKNLFVDAQNLRWTFLSIYSIYLIG